MINEMEWPMVSQISGATFFTLLILYAAKQCEPESKLGWLKVSK